MKTNIYKVELLIVDLDSIGAKEITSVIENQRYPNHCISPEVMNIDKKTINWTDEHPLNYANTTKQEYERLFNTKAV